MESWSKLKSAWRNLFHQPAVEQDLDDEVKAYVEMAIEEKVSAGMRPDEARRAVLSEMGGAERLKHSVREVRAGNGFALFLQDIRYGLRGLRRNPGFVAIAGLSLALGIGANSTIFSALNTVLLKPLPYPHPERLVVILQTAAENPSAFQPPPIAELNDWQQQSRVFDDIALTSHTQTSNISGLGTPEPIRLQYVTPTFFHVLQVNPVLGRVFVQSDLHDKSQTIILSYAYWQRRFQGNPNVLGKTFTIQGVASTVVGVMPKGFAPFVGDRIDLWWPIDPHDPSYARRNDHWLMPVARLKTGVTMEEARKEIDVIAARLASAYRETNKDKGYVVLPLQEQLFGRMRDVLYPLLGAVAFVLLIACVNVANLLQSRAEKRRKEFALRTALGAGRLRIIRQLLTESALLAIIGGVLGIALTFAGVTLFRNLAVDFPNAASIGVDGRVLVFTLAVSMVTALLVGLMPAIHASNPDPALALQQGDGRTATASGGYARRLLVISEVALATVLLVGAGLMINTVLRLQHANQGFNPENVTTMDIQLPAGGKYLVNIPGQDVGTVSPRATTFYEQLLNKVSAFPGVQSVGITSSMPGQSWQGRSFSIVGHASPPSDDIPFSASATVSPGYFHVLQIPLVQGRYLDEHDTESSSWSVVINQAFAKQYFPHENPIGQQLLLRFGDLTLEENRPRRIVGIVGNVRQKATRERPISFVYISYQQPTRTMPGGWVETLLHQTLVLRTDSKMARHIGDLAVEVKNAVSNLDPDQPVTGVLSMREQLTASIGDSLFYMRLLGLFAGIAALLASIGIYGVMSYFVSERTHEIGVRMALGATRRDVLSLVSGLGIKMTLIGLGIGSALALGLSRLIASLLFGVKPGDPATYGIVALSLAAVALLACIIPARRASRVDPVIALRQQ